MNAADEPDDDGSDEEMGEEDEEDADFDFKEDELSEDDERHKDEDEYPGLFVFFKVTSSPPGIETWGNMKLVSDVIDISLLFEISFIIELIYLPTNFEGKKGEENGIDRRLWVWE